MDVRGHDSIMTQDLSVLIMTDLYGRLSKDLGIS
jgi:hypothetical protein